MLKPAVVYEDRLVRRIQMPDKSLRYHGKRVPADCLLDRSELRAYVREGAISAVKVIRMNRNVSLHDALDLLNKARGRS